MNHTKLYEITKCHRDVWGKHFHSVGRSNGSTEFVRHYTNDAPEPEHVEAELLGLGVEWLAEHASSMVFVGPVAHDNEYLICVSGVSGKAPSLLAAVYAAIAEVKRGEGTATD